MTVFLSEHDAARLGITSAKVRTKYGNEPIEIDGYRFDSKAEARRYQELLLLEAAGQIEELTVHPVYELQAAFRGTDGKRHSAIRYEADFSYIEVIDPNSVQGRLVAEDVKGHRTAVFLLKEKLFRFRYPHIEFRVLDIGATSGADGGVER